MCLAQGHNTVTPVGIEPRTPGFGARHSTTTPPRSLFFNLTSNNAEFWAEKSAFFPPEASQQEPGEFLVPVFHTRPYHAVPECVTLAQQEACQGGLPSP